MAWCANGFRLKKAGLLEDLSFALVFFTLLSKIAFQGDEDELHPLTVLCDFTNPFRFDVFEGIFRIDAEAEHYRVRVIVGERTKSIEFFLTCCI